MNRIIIGIFTLLLSGCYSSNSLYSGIQAKDILKPSEVSNADLLYEYKGSTENWAANYIIYKQQGEDNHTNSLILKYIGKKPEPTGKISYSYDTEAAEAGRGEFPVNPSKNRIYFTGSSGGNGAIPRKGSFVTIQIKWNGQLEKFELQTKE